MTNERFLIIILALSLPFGDGVKNALANNLELPFTRVQRSNDAADFSALPESLETNAIDELSHSKLQTPKENHGLLELSAKGESLLIADEERESVTEQPKNVSPSDSAEDYANDAQNSTHEEGNLNSSPLEETVANPPEDSTFVSDGTPAVGAGSSWLAQFLENGRGIAWMVINLGLLALTVSAGLLSLFRLLALRSCTPLLSRTLYLLVLLLSFTAAAFTSVHLIHLIFGGSEGLPILLTLILTHTPSPCLTSALVMILHRILLTARLPWPISCSTLGRISTVLIVLSVLGDIATAIAHSKPFLLTCRVTLTTLALLPVMLFLLRYYKIKEVSKVLKTEFNGELKLMVPPPKESLAQEQNAIRALLRDILPTWSAILLACCVFTVIMWTCNLSISVFFAVARVPIWMWWLFHITNCICQIVIILLLNFSCAVTQDGQHRNLWCKLFTIPKDILNPPSVSGTANEQRNFVYERVSYSTSNGPESSQRTSSTQNDSEEVDGVRVGVDAPHHQRPRVTLQRSATFNCAPRPPMYGGFYHGYPHLIPQDYQRTGSYGQISPSHGAVRGYAPSMLLQEGGFIRFNMPLPNTQYPVPPNAQYPVPPNAQYPVPVEMANEQQQKVLPSSPAVDIEYNSLRRFPRRYYPSRLGAAPSSEDANKYPQPYGPLTSFGPLSSPNHYSARPQSPYPASPSHSAPMPVSPYHALQMSPFVPPNSVPSDGRGLPGPPALPSRAGSFRNHYAPATPPTTPLSSPYSPLPSAAYKLSSRPTSPVTFQAPPPPPTVPVPLPSCSPSGRLNDIPSLSQKGGRGEEKPAEEPVSHIVNGTTSSDVPSRTGSISSIPHSKAELQLHPEKSLENTVRDILSSGDKPLIKPRKHNLTSSMRLNKKLPHPYSEGFPNGLYANVEGIENNLPNSPSKNASSTSCLPIDSITPAPDCYAMADDESLQRTGSGLKRNHSTAGCYRADKASKDSYCQTDDENGKYASFRLSQLRNKPSDWYGTWAGRRKSKTGAYSIDPPGENGTVDKKLSSSRASLLSLYTKLKKRKDKSDKNDSSGESTEKDERDEVSQTSTTDDTPSELTDGVSIAPDEVDENPLEEALEEILEPKEPSADWTMDILSSSSVLSDFYKLKEKTDRPPPLPELSEVET